MNIRGIRRTVLLCAVSLAFLPFFANAAPTWKQITLPSKMVSGGGNLFPLSDGYVYAVAAAGSSGREAEDIYRAPLSTVVTGKPTWTSLGSVSSTSCSYCSGEIPTTMMATPNGTIFIAMTNGHTYSNVLYWNGSTSAPAWHAITGYPGTSTSYIYGFTQDSQGYTYFSPAWSGDVWRNVAPNSTDFTLMVSNVYQQFGQMPGGIYAEKIINTGQGDRWWGCGEGGVLSVDLTFSTATSYLDSGYTGNCTNIANSPSTILVTRTSTFPSDLSAIDTSTMAVTDQTCSAPRASTSCVSMLVNTGIGGMNFLHGSQFVWNAEATSVDKMVLLMSSDNGNTWNDITPGLGSTCSALNLQEFQSFQPPNDIFAKCKSGTVYWVYGPV